MKYSPQIRATIATAGIIGLGMTAQMPPKKQAPSLTKRKVEHVAGLVGNMDKAAAKRARKANKRLQETNQ